jgi:hypothetical protein
MLARDLTQLLEFQLSIPRAIRTPIAGFYRCRPSVPFVADCTSPSQGLRRAQIFSRQTLPRLFSGDIIHFLQRQPRHPSAHWTPMTSLDVKRSRGPFVAQPTAPTEFCRAVHIQFRNTRTAARLSNFPHFLNCSALHAGARGTPTTFANAGRNRFPGMANAASPQQRRDRINVRRGNTTPASLAGERGHFVNGQLLHPSARKEKDSA